MLLLLILSTLLPLCIISALRANLGHVTPFGSRSTFEVTSKERATPFGSRNSLETMPQAIYSNILVGDAMNISDNSAVQLTAPNQSSSTGLLIWKKSIPNRSQVSFSTDFTFSISPHNGDGLAFVMFQTYPFELSRNSAFGIHKGVNFFGVEFDTLVDENVGDVNSNHVGIDVNSFRSVEVCDLSKTGLVLNSGIKMRSWISYDSSSKRLEVRLSKFGSARPYDPLIAYEMDLGEMWGDRMVSMGLSSSNGESLQSVVVYSWNVRTWSIPKSLHSQPFDPLGFGNGNGEVKKVEKKRSCVLGFLSGLIFVTGCGALAAFVVLSLWVIISSSNEVEIPVKFDVRGGNFAYEKINVVVGDSSVDIKKQNNN
ncbi:hypothetical protein Leryth_007446 [Lithospermum erythrorhizon]|nr:hypothetical protein Leryth_007446 [Lithospermum erythrorhizon]